MGAIKLVSLGTSLVKFTFLWLLVRLNIFPYVLFFFFYDLCFLVYEILAHAFDHFYLGLLFYLLLFVRVHYIFWIQIICWLCIKNTFSQSLSCLFTCFNGIFCCTKVFTFNVGVLIILSLWFCSTYVYLKLSLSPNL